MSYTLAYTGAEIDALLGKIDAIFVAEYGSTIYSEVTAAIAAGNKVIVANAGKVFVYAGTDDNGGYVFTQSGPNAAKPNATYVTLSTGNVWSTATVDLATLQQFYASLMEDTASGSIASFPDGAENVPVKEMVIQIEPVQSGSGDPSPDNIRPISGYTGAEITRTGKNLWAGKFVAPLLDTEYDEWVSGRMPGMLYLPVSEGDTFAFSINGTAHPMRYSFFDADKVWIGPWNNANTVTVPSGAAFMRWRWVENAGEAANAYNPSTMNAMLERGLTVTEYEPQGTVYSVSWSDEAGTVYKGSMEYQGEGKWKVTATYGKIDLGTRDYSYTATWGSNTNVFTDTSILPNAKAVPSNDNVVLAISSMYKAVSRNAANASSDDGLMAMPSGSNQMFFINHAYTDAATFKTAMSGQTLVYELASPTSFIIDGPDPETLLGDNNMWSNTGDISVKYRANTALYIEKKLGE